MSLPWHLYLMAAVYIVAGLNHFRNSALYLKIIPPYFPIPKLLNKIAGIAEIIFGVLLCIPSVSIYGALGIIGVLIAVFPANLYMFQNPKAHLGLPKWLLLLRLPLQLLLIYWAYQYISF
jgi:uncharacterized membrane protein